MYSYSLFPCITKLTRVTSKPASLLDNIFYNNIVDNQDVFTGILYTDISDYFPIFYIDKATGIKNPPKYFKKRIYSQESLELFSNLLQNNDWSNVLSSENPQDAFQLFSDCYRDVYDKCFPLRTIKCGYKTRKPWLSEGLKRSIKTKNKLFHRKQKTKRLQHETIYKKYRYKLNKLLLMAERKHYEQRLEENKCNLKGSWCVLKDIIDKKRMFHHVPTFSLITKLQVTSKLWPMALIRFPLIPVQT